jgi:site-specific DNA-methyltransferase (adenine-specific)
MNYFDNLPRSIVFNEDCVAAMKRYPDGLFDIAICDPPYGINVAQMNLGVGKGKRCSKVANRQWKTKDWDSGIPDKEYFEQLFRVSKNQIIWGGNYFTEHLPSSQYFAIWDKAEGMYGRSFAECEYAWVRSGGTRIRKISPVQKQRMHPTQKPIELYDWLISVYCKNVNCILDTHVGSGSSRIAAEKAGLRFVGYEIDAEYYEKQEKRFNDFQAQCRIF